MSSTVAPERILKDLANLWADLARQESGDGSTGVLRACTMTLVVLAEYGDDAQSIGEMLAQLMPEHPSRAIVVRVRESAERAMESRVFSQCWTSFGERRHICAEEIEITTSTAALEELPLVVLPLAEPDLPVVLWCRGARVCEMPGFAEMASLATKVVLDSATFGSAAAGFDRLRAVLTQGKSAGDLAWARLTRWRELIARIFQNRGLSALPQVSEVRVAYPPAAGQKPGPSPLYMAAWLMDGLRRCGANPRLEMERGAAGERRVTLSAPGLQVRVSHQSGRCAEVRINDMVSQTPLAEPSERSLVAEELGIPGHDATFETTLSAAAQLAVSS